jgi:methyl-accepting chemotaxis protein
LRINLKVKLYFLSLFAILIFFPLSGMVLSSLVTANAEQIIADKASVLLATANSARSYTSENSKLLSALNTNEEFFPQTVPAYAAREIFEKLKAVPQYGDFIYKEATLNPTNLIDKADEFETLLVEKFRQNDKLKEVKGIRTIEGERFFYISRPLSVSAPSCLSCHGRSQDAPTSLIAKYGDKNGFNWKLNEIVAAQYISIPIERVLVEARQLEKKAMLWFGLFFLVVLAIANFCLREVIVQPLIKLTKVATANSRGDFSKDFEYPSNDEIGDLSEAFKNFKASSKIALDKLNRFTNYRG